MWNWLRIGGLVFGMFAMAGSLFAQLKLEKEVRIDPDSLPLPAARFIEDAALSSRIRWYRETQLEGYSFEAKFKHQGYRYSVEFDSLGQIEDVEVEWKKSELPLDVQSAIGAYLAQQYKRSRLQKIQIQYTGEAHLLQALISGASVEEELTIRYELIVKAWSEAAVKLFEMTFEADGSWRTTNEIVFKFIDHLVY